MTRTQPIDDIIFPRGAIRDGKIEWDTKTSQICVGEHRVEGKIETEELALKLADCLDEFLRSIRLAPCRKDGARFPFGGLDALGQDCGPCLLLGRELSKRIINPAPIGAASDRPTADEQDQGEKKRTLDPTKRRTFDFATSLMLSPIHLGAVPCEDLDRLGALRDELRRRFGSGGKGEQTKPKPTDRRPMSKDVACQNYEVTQQTIKRKLALKRKDPNNPQGLTDLRSTGHAKNSPIILDGNEVVRMFKARATPRR